VTVGNGTNSPVAPTMDSRRFGTAINCMDGRVQAPVARWLQETYHLDYVDAVTEPGPDRALANGHPDAAARIRSCVEISVGRHGSTVIAVVGHHDCAGAPGSREEHHELILEALQAVRLWNFSATVVGLWVNERWEVEVVSG
jgi:hypothetical protein